MMVSARVMVKCRGHLDQSLKKSFLRQRFVQPDLFPSLVRLKKFPPIEQRHSVLENRLFLGTIVFHPRFLGA